MANQAMNLPITERFEGIKEKLEYAEKQRMDLTSALFGTYEGNRPLPQFLRQTAEGILGHARECLDHLGLDLIEKHLLPTADAAFLADYHSGRTAAYFPFFATQLSNPKNAFLRFKQVNPSVFIEVETLIAAMDAKAKLPMTNFDADDFRTLRKMVNDKKHSRVMEYQVVADQSVFARGPMGTVIMDKSQFSVPGTKIGDAFGGHSPKSVPAYRFANGKDIPNFCLFATRATAIVMNNFYGKFFSVGSVIDLDAFQRGNAVSG